MPRPLGGGRAIAPPQASAAPQPFPSRSSGRAALPPPAASHFHPAPRRGGTSSSISFLSSQALSPARATLPARRPPPLSRLWKLQEGETRRTPSHPDPGTRGGRGPAERAEATETASPNTPPPALLLLNPHSLTASPIQSGALQPAARPKITPGAILKLQGGTVPAPDLRLCLSSQHKPATSMCVSADARPRKEERAGGREGGRGRAQVHVPPVNWEPPLPYCTQTAPPITSQPCRLVSHSTGLGLGGREGPRGRWAWVHVCV